MYFKCEDIMTEKANNIHKMQKNVEKLGEVAELMEALGSDAEKDPDALIDNDGNPIRMKKKKSKMCTHVQQKKLYKEDGIDMKTKDKYYVDAHIARQNILDPKSERMKCIVCPQGKECPHAHSAIELDLTPLPYKIKNLKGVIKAQQYK